jgi:16S rRNA (guanine966-N2)-methyltransferase
MPSRAPRVGAWRSPSPRDAVRVIAGRFGGRRLGAPHGFATRPTAEHVREALFSMLGDVAGLEVLDLFAGTGALGIEALSRGAASAAFVEADPQARAALRRNLASLGIAPAQALVRGSRVPQAMRKARARRETYDLVFIDPPYGQAQGFALELDAALPPLLRAGARVVVESDRRAPLELALPIARQRRYGDTLITIHMNPDTSERR